MKHFFNTYKIIILQTLITFFNLKIQNNSNENDDYQIKFVFEIMRHGARSPETLYSSSSSSEEIYDLFHEKWPDGPTELTSLGIRQHFLIGYRNYLRYINNTHFLKEYYEPDEIQLISTPLNRTIMSMNAEIHGMFLPGNGPYLDDSSESEIAVPPLKSNENYNKERIDLDKNESYAAIKEKLFVLPVYTFNPKKFNTQKVKAEHCKALKKVYEKRYKDDKYQEFYKKLNESYGKVLTRILKKKNRDFISDHDFISNLTDAAIADYTDNRTLNIVDYFDDSSFDEENFIDFVENYAFKFSYLEYIGNFEKYDKEIAQVAASQTFEYILDWMKNIKENKKKNPKFVIFSMHETNLGPFTFFLKKALDIDYPDNFVNYANFSANAHLELFYKKSKKKYYVNYFFNDQSIKNIPFDDFEDKISEFIMNEDKIHYYCNEENKNDYIVVISILSSIVVILIITLVIIYFKIKKKKFNSIEKINSFDLYEN